MVCTTRSTLLGTAALLCAIGSSLINPALANPANPQAQTSSNNTDSPSFPYLSLQAGVAFPQTLTGDIDILGFRAAIGNALKLNAGVNAEAALGYKWPTVRTDLSVSYSRFNSLSQTNSVAGFGSISNPGKGNVELSTLMFNAYYDIPIHGANESNQLRFHLSSTDANLNSTLNQSIEIWDPNAQQQQRCLDSLHRTLHLQRTQISTKTTQPPTAARHPAAAHPLGNLPHHDQPLPITLTARNGADMSASGTALLLSDPNALLFSTQLDHPGVLHPSDTLPLRPELLSSPNNLTPPPTQRTNNANPVLVVDPFSVNAASAFAVFSVHRRQIPSRWSPYLGAGMGIANVANPGCAITNCSTFQAGSDTTFAFQLKAGLSYRVHNSGSLFLEGAYLRTDPYNIANVSYDPFSFWSLNLGWRQRL